MIIDLRFKDILTKKLNSIKPIFCMGSIYTMFDVKR